MGDEALTTTIKSFDELAQDYAKSRMDIGIVQHLADFFLRQLTGKKILDVGCGPGRDAKYFAEHGCSVVGIDLAENFVAIPAALNILVARFMRMDMRALAFPAESYDGVWACASLHHIPKEEAAKALLEFHRVLRNTGVVLVSVRNGTGEEVVQRKIDKFKPKFFSYYTQEQLKAAVQAAGFTVLRSTVEESVTGIWTAVFARKQSSTI